MKPICAAPWTHVYIKPNGKFSLCCATSNVDYEKSSIEEWWNSAELRDVRIKMLRHELPADCRGCDRGLTTEPVYIQHNEHAGSRMDTFASQTTETGYSDTKPDNARIGTHPCNFKCRMCSADHSTAILNFRPKEEQVEWSSKKGALYEKDFLDSQFLAWLKWIDWVGGEPFMSSRYWATLNRMVEDGTSHLIHLGHVTNLSFPGKTYQQALEAWQNFQSISITASVDAFGPEGEFLRTGWNEQEFCDNWNRLKRDRPRDRISVAFSLTSVGVTVLPEFISKMLEMKPFLIRPRLVDTHMTWLQPGCLYYGYVVDQIDKAKNRIRGTELEYLETFFDHVLNEHRNMASDHEERMIEVDQQKFLEFCGDELNKDCK